LYDGREIDRMPAEVARVPRRRYISLLHGARWTSHGEAEKDRGEPCGSIP
jgi:hypothetical protein